MELIGSTELEVIEGRIFWRQADMPGRRWQRTPFAASDFVSLADAAPAVAAYREQMFAPTDIAERQAQVEADAAQDAERAAAKAARLAELRANCPGTVVEG